MRDRRLLRVRPAALVAVFAFAACGGRADGVSKDSLSGSNLNGQSPTPLGDASEGDDAGQSSAPMAGSNDLSAVRTHATAADGGPSLPATGLSVRCNTSFSTIGPAVGLVEPPVRGGRASLAVGPAGNVVVATGFQQRFTAGSQTFSPMGGAEDYENNLAVVMLDPQCHVLWTKQIGAYGAELDLSAVAVDGSGDVILGGSFQTNSTFPGMGAVDFGMGLVTAPSISAYVVKLDPRGATRWAKVYPGHGSGSGAWVSDVAASATDHVVVAIRSDTATNFGAGVLSPGNTGTGADLSVVVDLGPDGSLGFAKPSDALAPSSWLIDSVDVAPDGSFWIGGTGSIDTFPTNGQGDSSSLRAVHLDASGAVLASQTIASPSHVGWNGGAVRVGPSGDAIVSGAWAADNTSLDWTRWFEALAPSGQVRWTYPALPASQIGWNPAEFVRVDADGRAWTAGEIAAPLDLGSPVGTLGASNSVSGYVAILGTGGHVLSGSAPAALVGVQIADMGLTPDGDVVVTGWDGNGNLAVTTLGF
jgi:hypothetical protein